MSAADIADLNAALAATAPVFGGPAVDLFAGTRLAPHHPASAKQAPMEDDSESSSDEERDMELSRCREALRVCEIENSLLRAEVVKLRGKIGKLGSQSKSSGGRKDTRRRRKKRRKKK